ncbi:MAG TPA: ABC transporter permease [Bryobacteraceae bacterium]
MSWFSRLRNAVRPRQLDEDLADEMRDHVERRADALRAAGCTPNEARRQAAIGFGNFTKLREQSRDVRLWAGLESMLQDVRYAWRGMRKNPAFAVTAVLSLGLAIGANTAIYSVVDAAILRPLPVPEPERLFTLGWPGIEEPGSETSPERDVFGYSLYQQLRVAAGDSARLALFSYPNRIAAQGPNPNAPVERIIRQFVSGDAFAILQVPPALGRVFSSDDDRVPGGHPVAVLSHDYWRRRFHADPAVIGRRLQIDGKNYYVIGVAREGFFGIEPGKFVDVWLPAMMYDKDALINSNFGWFRIAGRLAPGVTREQVQARLQPSFHVFQEDSVKRNATMPLAVQKQYRKLVLHVHPGATGPSGFRTTFTRPLWIVLGAAVGILLIACANVASLLLARFTARAAEMAMRVSLGAGRRRLMRQLLTESLLLSAMAGVLGWVAARMVAPVLVSWLSKESDPVRFALAMDTRVLLFCVAVSTLAAVFFGLLPAWQATGAQPIGALRGTSGQAGKLRMGRFCVGLQVAFAFCLVMAGASFLFSLRNLFAINPGFDAHGVAVLSFNNDSRDTPEQLRGAIATLPGIQAAAVASWAIFNNSGWGTQVILPGKALSERKENFYSISPGYFTALRTPLLSGRDFERHDTQETKMVPTIVNQAFARRYFGGENALGRTFQRASGESHQIIGIAADAHYYDLRHEPPPLIYAPIGGANYFALYVRSTLDVGSVARLVERESRTMGMRVQEITTLDTLVGNTLLREKLLAGIGGVFAFLGLLLAAIGLFGLLNYSVARRTKEIGIRAALGARRGELVLLVLKDLGAMVGTGLLAGLAGSLGLMTFLQSLLFGIKAADPLVIATAMSIFLFAAFAAGALPANRAAGVDPMVALRQE